MDTSDAKRPDHQLSARFSFDESQVTGCTASTSRPQVHLQGKT